jgi:hypothetical protein
MIEEITGYENLRARTFWLENRLNELRVVLNALAADNALGTPEAVTSTRQEFGFAQLEIVIRNKQVGDLTNGFEMRSVATLLDQIPSGDAETRDWLLSDQSAELRAAQDRKQVRRRTLVR